MVTIIIINVMTAYMGTTYAINNHICPKDPVM